MYMNDIERFEVIAHAFKATTGMMHPGKEPPMDGLEEPFKVRSDAWFHWNHTYGKVATRIMNAVCAVLPDCYCAGSPDPSADERPEHVIEEREPQCFNNVDSLQDRVSDLERALREILSKFPGSTLGYEQYARAVFHIAHEAIK